MEWNLDGQLLSRTPVHEHLDHGRAYTSSGRFFGCWGSAQTKQSTCGELDKDTGQWKNPSTNLAAVDLLLGAEGDELAFRDSQAGVYHLRWITPPTSGEVP